MTAMNDVLKELKALEELTENLRLLFRNEDLLKAEGWYSDSEFLEAVKDEVNDYVETMQEE